jgi:hypothetical protein
MSLSLGIEFSSILQRKNLLDLSELASESAEGPATLLGVGIASQAVVLDASQLCAT